MSGRLAAVMAARQRLRLRIESQRADVEYALSGLHGPLRAVDRAAAGAAWLRAHPLALVVPLAAAVLVGRRRLPGLLVRAVGLWRFGRYAAALLRDIRR